MKSLILKDFEVRGVLDGTITQIVRVAKLPHQNPLGVWEAMRFGGPNGGKTRDGKTIPEQGAIGHTRTGHIIGSPFGHPGELLWVREKFSPYERRQGCWYWADGRIAAHDCTKPMSASQMSEYFSRITLKNAGVRVERVQDCSEVDARARGVTVEAKKAFARVDGVSRPAGFGYRDIYTGVNGAESWERNDWIFVLDVERVKSDD